MLSIQPILQNTELFSYLPSTDQVQQYINATLKMLPQLPDFNQAYDLVIRFVDENESQHLNQTFRQKNTPTNVLAFPFEDTDNTGEAYLGDLAICPLVGYAEAEAQGKSISDHFAHLIIHGLLHLLGFDHIQADDKEVMEALEVKILKSLHIANPF